MARLDELLPRVAVQAAGAPDILLRSVLLDSAREFFRRSRGWRHLERNLVRMGGDDGHDEYLVPLAQTIAVAEVVELRGYPRDYYIPPEQYRKTGASEFRVEAQPSADYVGGEFALMPVGWGAEIPDMLFGEFDEALIAGALARLHIMPDGAWAQPNLSGYHREVYELAIDRASTRAADGFTSGRARKVRYGGY